ncbi:MAG: HAD family hydrolase [Caldisericia bacterium]|nr:HAD family hydrolase [Caldisericia bacterium]
MWQGVVFDLDGTLLDTIADLGDAMNEVLVNHGWPVFSIADYKEKIGDGIGQLVKRSVPVNIAYDAEVLSPFIQEFVKIYEQRWHVKTKPYPGILLLLHTLQEKKVKMAILSNKMDLFTQLCVRHFFPDIQFDYVVGSVEGTPKKPDPMCALQIAAHLQLDPKEILYVGDTPIDMNTANNAGMKAIGVSWGFRSANQLVESGAMIILNKPEFLEWLF